MRVRVTLAATVVSVLGAVVGSVLFVGGLNENLEQGLLSSARQQADTVDAQLRAGSDVRQATTSGKTDLIIQVVDSQGRVEAGNHPEVTAAIKTTPGKQEGVEVRGLPDSYAAYATPSAGGRLVIVGVSEEQVGRATDIAVALLAIAVPIGIGLLAGVVWLAIGRALRPVEVMRREAATITSEHLHRRLAVPEGDDEIPLLAVTLNEMLERIDRAQQLQRQFVSDASHELRTPLATVKQMVEVARRHPDRTSVNALADDVLAEETRMEGLVRALLTLARLDDGEAVHPESIDLDDVVLAEVGRLRAAGTGIRYDNRGVSGGQVRADRVLVAQVVTNLLSNATRHAHSVVRVSVREDEDQVTFVVEDDGAGVGVEDRERIFERFARLDEARARDAGGAGLGLAIVAKVVENSHGSVIVSDSDLGGARFVVTLPTA